MGATSRLFHMLLSTAPTQRLSAPALRFARRSIFTIPAAPFFFPNSSLRRCRLFLFSPQNVGRIPLHTHSVAGESHGDMRENRSPWPEWAELVEHVASGGYGGRGEVGGCEDAFEESLEVSEDFTLTARAFLSFAHDRPALLTMLSKKDVKVVIDNVTPFLFRRSSETVKRMKAYLDSGRGNVLPYENARTVDLVRYLISHVHDHLLFAHGNMGNISDPVDMSVCNLLREMIHFSGPLQKLRVNASTNVPNSLPFLEQSQSHSHRSDMAMKRSDWLCPKCNFMNFAKNMKCLQCKEAHPTRQLIGGEWECPRCDFFNYGRNMACLRCDCKRPEDGYYSAALHTSSGSTGTGAEHVPSGGDSISETLDRILNKTSDSTGVGSRRSNIVTSGRSGVVSPQRRESKYIPFVPLSADMFKSSRDPNSDQSEKPSDVLFSQNTKPPAGSSSSQESSNPNRISEHHPEEKSVNRVFNNDFPEITPIRKSENSFVDSKHKGPSLVSPQHKRRLPMEEASGSNFVPFVPFPPDYFARKDSQQHSPNPVAKLSIADSSSKNAQNVLEKPNETKYPDWISSKNHSIDQQRGNVQLSSSDYNNPKEKSERSFSQGSSSSQVDGWRNLNQSSFSTGKKSWSNENNWISDDNSQVNSYNRRMVGNHNSSKPSSWNSNIEEQKVDPSWSNHTNDPTNGSNTVPHAETNQGTRESPSWKSLEGSAVTEPDPLDMSEEAVAQRWFRRVAQITDISELANIPDEDFPKIMPMRKGVNRFVVSKRKTPLERRLTSPQYRRNLPIVSSENESDSSNKGKD